MKRRRFLEIFVCIAMPVLAVAQQPPALCEQVLVPTVEQSNSDYRRLQSFMSLHAAEEYDRLQHLESSARSVEASYKVFSAEYNDATSRQDFSERVRRRLDNEAFHLDEAEARSYFKRGLTDRQVDAWTTCVTRISGAGGFLLSPRSITRTGFTLVAARVLPTAIGTADAKIQITGGTAEDGHTIGGSYNGSGTVVYQIKRESKAPEIRVSGTLMGGFADEFLVDYRPAPANRPTPAQITFRAKDINTGGYYRYDSAQDLTVSAEPNGGPSENFSVLVTVPKAAGYSVDAMWAAGTDVEVYIYTPPPVVSTNCWEPVGWNLHKFPTSTGGWDKAHLSRDAERLGNLVLRKGANTILFTQRPCGGGKGGGRLPSVAWIRFIEVQD